jgi:hypothetical protein
VQEGRKECRRAETQVDRQTDTGTERQMYKYTYRQTEIKTYRHTQTNRQTEDSAKVLVQAEKQADVQKKRPIFTLTVRVHTYSTVHKTDMQTDRQIDRQDRQKKMTYRSTNLQTDNI